MTSTLYTLFKKRKKKNVHLKSKFLLETGQVK